jgi:hypothetical protein
MGKLIADIAFGKGFFEGSTPTDGMCQGCCLRYGEHIHHKEFKAMGGCKGKSKTKSATPEIRSVSARSVIAPHMASSTSPQMVFPAASARSAQRVILARILLDAQPPIFHVLGDTLFSPRCPITLGLIPSSRNAFNAPRSIVKRLIPRGSSRYSAGSLSVSRHNSRWPIAKASKEAIAAHVHQLDQPTPMSAG